MGNQLAIRALLGKPPYRYLYCPLPLLQFSTRHSQLLIASSAITIATFIILKQEVLPFTVAHLASP